MQTAGAIRPDNHQQTVTADTPGPVRGIALGLYGDNAIDLRGATGEIARMGATHIALVVSWSQQDIFSNQIARGPITVPDRRLCDAIRIAHQAGLRVLIFPILTVVETRAGQWRGTIKPTDRSRWWSHYERFILHYARIARLENAEALLIGSELSSTEGWRDRWFHLISRIEKIYAGHLVYSANWDHYHQVSFWQRIDQVGITGYFQLTTSKTATAAEMERSWRKHRDELLGFAAKVGKPLWLTEVGYTSTDGTAITPWDYTTESRVDVEEQRRAYEAFTKVWRPKGELAGVFYWSWDGAGGRGDRGYTPRGKPARAILEQWLKASSVVEPGGTEENDNTSATPGEHLTP